MNPNPFVMKYLADQNRRESEARRQHRDALHRKAVERRRKAKRGGKR